MIVRKIKRLLSSLKNGKIVAEAVFAAAAVALLALQEPAPLLGGVILLYLWLDTERQKKGVEKELKMHKLYESPYKDAVESAMMRQHGFENQLNAILCLCSTIDDYDELVSAQKEYCRDIVRENRVNKILKGKMEPVITGFLYSKIMLAERFGIEMACEIYDIETEKIVKSHDLIEMAGVLIDNAIDALRENGGRKLVVRLAEDEAMRFVVEVANISRIYKNIEIEKFCSFGYSSKGAGRGLGLARLRELVLKNKAELSIRNRAIDHENYLSFKIIFLYRKVQS